MKKSVFASVILPTEPFVLLEDGKSPELKKWTEALPVVRLVSTDPAITQIDAEYQRPQNDKKIRKIADNFDVDLFIPPLINQRFDPATNTVKYFNMDGQHRQLAARLAGYEEMPGLFYEIGGQQNEAAMFVRTNRDRTAVSRYHQHKASVAANDPIAKGIDGIFTKYGIQPRNQGRDGSAANRISALGKVQRMYEADPIVFDLTFKALIEAYHGDNYSLRVRIISGTFAFIKLYENSPAFSYDRLILAMQKITPEALYDLSTSNRAENFQKVIGLLLKSYNMTDGPRLRRMTLTED